MRRIMLTVVVAGLAAGCGGGSGRLSKAEYAKRADAICTKYNAKIRALGRPTAISGLPAYVDKALPLARKGDHELSALKPPKDEERTAKEWLDQNDSVVGSMERLRDAAKKGDRAGIQTALNEASSANQTGNRLARKLGLSVCAQG
jgi:hypothetical protein